MLAAAGVVGLIALFLLIPPGSPSHRTTPAPPAAGNLQTSAAAGAIRPLGLAVNPSGATTWLVSWNPNATALNGARGVQLFVRDGDDQNRIDLSTRDLASGTYQYHPVAAKTAGADVTFRLEVTEPSGVITAESFRFRQVAAPAPPSVASAPSPTAATPPPPAAAMERIPPKPIQRVPPVVGAGVRPRIPGIIPIDIRVMVDRKGRVTSAQPLVHSSDTLHKYLTDRAVAAARQWRFEPARAGGQAVEGDETIHFVFQK
jgi:TonB family protein